MRILSFLLALSFTVPAIAAPPKDMPIYLLMGQSNMSGRGEVSELPEALPEALHVEAKGVWLYGNDGVWKPASDPLDSSTGQIDVISNELSSNGIDKAGVGPGLSFARTLGGPVGLVPCAKGGSSLSQWTPNAARTRLYGSCLARAREAAAHGRIAGVLWYQGETDAQDMAATQAWGTRMTTLIARLRSDLHEACLPWVVVGLSDRPDPAKWNKPSPGWADIQAAQAALPQTVKRVAHVSAAGLAKNPDGIHLTTQAQLMLGPKLAEAMRAVSVQPCS